MTSRTIKLSRRGQLEFDKRVIDPLSTGAVLITTNMFPQKDGNPQPTQTNTHWIIGCGDRIKFFPSPVGGSRTL